ncbi:unnamed protein product [Urochloa decumbens]|uniref:Uncharacterized protein n=1 Tax=Urochloa decumbens TaxID=240449 RepID=A0ABC9CXH0_9POAL
MGVGACTRLRRCGIAGGLGVWRSRARIHGGRKLQGRGGVGKVGGADGREFGAHGGRIEQAEDWIVVRGRRIRRAGFRINSQGDVYVPDSEEEEDDMETEGAAPVKVAAACSPTAALAMDVDPAVVVAAHGAPATEVSVDSHPGMELAPEVRARLKVVLAGKDPRYHDFFISLYKVMVPALFKSD